VYARTGGASMEKSSLPPRGANGANRHAEGTPHLGPLVEERYDRVQTVRAKPA